MIIDSPIISGSLASTGSLTQIGNVVITGSLSVSGPIKGNITGSADSASFATTSSYAFNAELLDGLNSTAFVYTSSYNVDSSSFSTRVTNTEATASSLVIASGSFSTRVTTLENASSSFAQQSGSNSTRLTNLETTASVLTTASASFAVVSSSFASTSASLSTRTTNLESTASVLTTASASFAIVSQSFSSTSQSVSTRVTTIERNYATTGSNLFTGTQGINNTSNAISFTSTASLYLDGGARITRDLYVSGNAFFNNVTIYGTQSVNYITSSQLNIGTNIITVNTDTPTVRYGGIAVYDSGSTGLTGSLLWDSEANHWIYTNPSGSTYSGGMMISGPRSSARGCEQGTTSCALMMGQGGDHITSSAIFHYGNATCFYGNTTITSTGVGCFAGAVCAPNITSTGTICSTGNTCFGGMSVVASCLGIGTATPGSPLEIYSSNVFNTSTGANPHLIINYNSATAGGPAIKFSRVGISDWSAIQADLSGGTRTLKFIQTASGIASTQMVINANDGNVGIGTISPCYKLDVSADINDGSIIRAVNLNSGAAATARFYAENNIGSLGQLTTYSSGFGFTVFGLAAGNYSALLSSGASSAGLLIGSLTSSPVVFGTNNIERLRITSTGIACFSNTVCAPNVSIVNCLGVGTAAGAGYILDVYQPASSTTAYARIKNNRSRNAALQLETNCGNFLVGVGIGTDTNRFMIYDNNAGATRLTLDDSGNLGLGVTPSAWWSGMTAQQIGTGGAIYSANGTNDIYIIKNAFYNGTNFKYVNSDFAGISGWNGGEFILYQAPSGTAGNNISFTQAMTLNALGNLGLGVSSIIVAGACRRHFQLGYSTCGAIVSLGTNVCESCNPRVFSGQYDLGFASGISTGNMLFYTNDSERLRITCTGEVLINSISGVYGGGSTNESRLLVVGVPPSIDVDRGLVSFMDCRAYNTTCLGAKLMLGASYASGGAMTFLSGLAGLKENTTDGNYAGALAFYTRPNGAGTSERMRITSGGNVGIGTGSSINSSPNYTALNINGTTGGEIYLRGSNTDYGYIYANSTVVVLATQTAIPLTFQTNATERLRIASTGAACFACELTAKSLGTNDLILNNLNHEHANYVDGTRGSWLIQEGACDLFIINQVSCKKYKFNLIEIK